MHRQQVDFIAVDISDEIDKILTKGNINIPGGFFSPVPQAYEAKG